MIILRNAVIILLLTLLFGCGSIKTVNPVTPKVIETAKSDDDQLVKKAKLLKQSRNFLEAAKNGDYQLVKKLLKTGVNLNVTDAIGWTALHMASFGGHTEIANFLIEKGIMVDAKDLDAWTALLVASANNHTNVVSLLIEKGADVNVKDKDGITPLHLAAVNGYIEIAKLLIQNCADINAQNKDGRTPQQLAESINLTYMVRLIVGNATDAKLVNQCNAKLVNRDNVGNPGNVEGIVKNALTGKPLSGALVKVFQQDHLIMVKKTDNNGYYAFVIPEGSYILKISFKGYNIATANINVIHNESLTVSSVRLVPQARSSQGIVTGQLLNAYNGKPVSKVTLKIRSGMNVTTGAVIATTKTDRNGYYRIKLPGGNYTIAAIKNAYATMYFLIVSAGNDTIDKQNASITPSINSGEIRIVLSWGHRPMDLDSHLFTPTKDHIYFSSKGKRLYAPYVELDVDDTTSYGPETITIYKSHAGMYRYIVHNYSGSPAIRTSNAKVEIYSEMGLVKSYNIPVSGVGDIWQVFSYNGSTGKITTFNKIASLKQ